MGRRQRRTRRLGLFTVVALVVALVALAETRAEAADCGNPLVSTCINSDTYWPVPGPMRFTGVAGTETVRRGQVGFGLVATYQSRPIFLQVASPGPGGSTQNVIDDQVNANFLFAYGLTDRLELDFALPVTLIQTGAGTSPLTAGRALRDTAVRDLRFGVAYAIVPRERPAREATAPSTPFSTRDGLALAGRFHVSAPTGDETDFAGERSAVFIPSLAADYRFGRLFFGAELGARIRPVTQFTSTRVGTQIVPALGVGVDVLEKNRLAFLLESRAYVNFPEQADTFQTAAGIQSTPNGNRIMPAEWMLSARTAPLLGGDISFQIGGGGPLPFVDEAITVPRFRFLLAAIYAPVTKDRPKETKP